MNCLLPSLTLKSSTKSVSSTSVKSFLVSVKVIFNLSAPGAAKLENPLALSYNDASFLALIISSFIFNPTL